MTSAEHLAEAARFERMASAERGLIGTAADAAERRALTDSARRFDEQAEAHLEHALTATNANERN